jgi:hypothetical protein
MQVASFKVGTCRLGGKAHRKRKDSRAHQEAIEVFGEVKPPRRLCLLSLPGYLGGYAPLSCPEQRIY